MKFIFLVIFTFCAVASADTVESIVAIVNSSIINYISNKLYLIDYTIVNERLCRWIGDELELPELSSELRRLLRENGSMEEFVLTILKESNIYAAAEIHKMQSVLEQLQSQRDVEKEK